MWYIYITEHYSAIKEEWNDDICSNMHWPREASQRPISYDTTYMQNLLKHETNELIYKIETDSQT